MASGGDLRELTIEPVIGLESSSKAMWSFTLGLDGRVFTPLLDEMQSTPNEGGAVAGAIPLELFGCG